ncbi:MAG: tetratricopeptide repeat protein [Trueperaceae bacterium]
MNYTVNGKAVKVNGKALRRFLRAAALSGLLGSGVLGTAVLAQDPGAVATYQQAVKSNPNDVANWVNLGNAQLAAGNFAFAKDAFIEAIARDYTLVDAHFGLGLSQYELGDYPAALFEFDAVTRLNPELFDGHFNRGVTLAKLRETEQATEAFNEAIVQADPEASDEQKVNAFLGLAGQLKRTQDFEGAADAYTQALEFAPEDPELAYLRGEALHRADKGLEALEDLSTLEAKSSDYRISALIADIYVQQGQTDYALRSLDRALSRATGAGDDKAEAMLLVKLGTLQQELGRNAEALGSFQRAAGSDPNDWQARYFLGLGYLGNGDFVSAVSQLESAAAVNPESAEVQLGLASAYEGAGQIAEMQRAAETVLAAGEGAMISEATFVLGRALYLQENYEGALAEFEAVLSGDLAGDDMMAEDVKATEEVTEIENTVDLAAVQLWAGLAEYKLENYMSSVQYLERAVQLNPDSVDARVNLGAAYIAAKRFEDAELVYTMIVEENPDDGQAFYNLGLSQYNQNNKDSAKEAWLRSSALGYAPAQEALQEYF